MSQKLPTVDVDIHVPGPNGQYVLKRHEGVEVLTVHFQKRTMRVRYQGYDWLGRGPKTKTRDLDATPYFEKYGEPG